MAKSDTRYEKSDIRYENSDIRCPLPSSRSDILCIGYIWYSLPPDTDEVSGIWKSLRICICSMIWFGQIWFGNVWSGQIWFGNVWFGQLSFVWLGKI